MVAFSYVCMFFELLLIEFGASMTGSIQVNISLPNMQESFFNIWPVYVFIFAPTFNNNENNDNNCLQHWRDYWAISLHCQCAKIWRYEDPYQCIKQHLFVARRWAPPGCWGIHYSFGIIVIAKTAKHGQHISLLLNDQSTCRSTIIPLSGTWMNLLKSSPWLEMEIVWLHIDFQKTVKMLLLWSSEASVWSK